VAASGQDLCVACSAVTTTKSAAVTVDRELLIRPVSQPTTLAHWTRSSALACATGSDCSWAAGGR